MDKNAQASLIKFIAELAKSVPEVKDLFDNYHARLEEAQVVTGAAQESSGGGAERMIPQYSETAPQVALAQLYKETAGLLSKLSTIKSEMADGFANLSKSIQALTNSQLTKGRTLAQAQADLEKALVSFGELKAKAAPAEKVAKAEKRIGWHRSEVSFLKAVESGSLTPEITAAYAKAESEKESGSDDEEEEVEINITEEEKAASYLKAVTDIEAMVASLEKGESITVAEGDTAKVRAKAVAERIVKAKANDNHDAGGKFSETNNGGAKDEKEKEELKGKVASLTKQLDEVSKSLAALSTGGAAKPELSAAQAQTLRDRVFAAIEKDELPGEAATVAKSLLQQHEAVANGKLGKDVFDRSLQIAPPSVKQLFTVN